VKQLWLMAIVTIACLATGGCRNRPHQPVPGPQSHHQGGYRGGIAWFQDGFEDNVLRSALRGGSHPGPIVHCPNTGQAVESASPGAPPQAS